MKTVVIIGTIHKPTNSYSKYDLLNILKTIKPSLLLEELPNSFYNDSGRRIIKRNYESQEEFAIDSYSKEFGIKVLPYDISNRQKIIKDLNLIENDERLFAAIDELIKSNDLTLFQRESIESSYELFRKRDEILKNGNWKEINNRIFDKINIEKEVWLKKLYLNVIPSHKKLLEFADYCKKYIEFWDSRNQGMCENIKRLAVEDGVTAVLIGVEHRYSLQYSKIQIK